jgi:putative molybdopterin biosynthesis protein
MEKLYTIKEVAEMLRVSKVTLYRMMKDGKIQTVKLGRKTLFTEEELDRFIESLKKGE